MCSLKGNKNAIKGNANFLKTRTHRRMDHSSVSAPGLLGASGQIVSPCLFPFLKNRVNVSNLCKAF